MISEEIRTEKFDSQSQQYSREVVSTEVSQQKKNEHLKKNKKWRKTWRAKTKFYLTWNIQVFLDKEYRINA